MRDLQLTEHFKLSEIACKCPYCGGELPAYNYWDRVMHTLGVLETVRIHFQNPFAYILITSGHRCKKHNDEVSTCKNPDSSQHRIFATDIQVIQRLANNVKRNVPATDIYDLFNRLISPVIGGIGIINDISVHFDLRETNPWRRREKYK